MPLAWIVPFSTRLTLSTLVSMPNGNVVLNPVLAVISMSSSLFAVSTVNVTVPPRAVCSALATCDSVVALLTAVAAVLN